MTAERRVVARYVRDKVDWHSQVENLRGQVENLRVLRQGYQKQIGDIRRAVSALSKSLAGSKMYDGVRQGLYRAVKSLDGNDPRTTSFLTQLDGLSREYDQIGMGVRLGRDVTASLTFRDEDSPLHYPRAGKILRLSLCDSDFVQPVYPEDYRVEKRRGQPRLDTYFVEEEEWRYRSDRRPYKRLKKPVLENVIPGVSDPCIVAFLDYHSMDGSNVQDKGGSWYLDYIRTRGGQQGKGHATMLIKEFFRRHPKANTIMWGKMMQPQIGHLRDKMQQKYPHIVQPGMKWF